MCATLSRVETARDKDSAFSSFSVRSLDDGSMKASDGAAGPSSSGESNHSDKPVEQHQQPQTTREPAGAKVADTVASRSAEAWGDISNGVPAPSVSSPASRSASRRPSRASSPARNLRSRPSVALSAYEATYFSNTAADSTALTSLEEDAALLYDALSVLESNDKELEVLLPPPQPIWTTTFADEPLINAGISDYTFIPPEGGGLLGKGKFSSVQLAWKDGQKYAVKITPLYPHHHLIATRLLREPTILAQLPLHPNLVRVYESIRTPGYFYLIEEFLDGYINLEAYVSSQPGNRLNLSQSTYIFQQLVSVVRSALHEPIQIAHRDIKPENILIHPQTLRIILLDFGLATHFSRREPKLTTCCGSPAFHAPELFLSLKSSPGSVRYWGPEIDIWTIGMTLLRCLTGVKYPLGVSHTSIEHMADKTIDALLSVPYKEFRKTLAGLLDMDGTRRMDAFRSLDDDIDRMPLANGSCDTIDHSAPREFKSVSFLTSEPKHTLPMPLVVTPSTVPTTPVAPVVPLPLHMQHRPPLSPRATSRDRLSSLGLLGCVPPADAGFIQQSPHKRRSMASGPAEIHLLNPTKESARRAISFVKYALRCAGILYHIQGMPLDATGLCPDLPSADAPQSSRAAPVLHCVVVLPKEKIRTSQAAALLNQLRPPIQRAQTTQPARSLSTPPSRMKSSSQAWKNEPPKYQCLEFWLQIIPVKVVKVRRGGDRSPLQAGSRASSTARQRDSSKRPNRSRTNTAHPVKPMLGDQSGDWPCSKLRVRVSDEQALEYLSKALNIGSRQPEVTSPDRAEHIALDTVAAPPTSTPKQEHDDEEEQRGRPTMSRSLSNGSHSKSPTGSKKSRSRSDRAESVKTLSRPLLTRAQTDAVPLVPVSEASPPDASQITDHSPVVSPISANHQLPQQRIFRSFFDLVSFGRRSASVQPSPAQSPHASSGDELSGPSDGNATRRSAKGSMSPKPAFVLPVL